MPHVTVGDVQVWLDAGKLLIPENDTLPEDQTFADIVFGRIGQVYTTTTWVDATTTPPLIKRIIAMLIAANRYNKIYSEEDDAGNRYANKLEGRAYDMVNMIVSGQIIVLDPSAVPIAGANVPVFYPDDQTGAVEIMNALGEIIGIAGSEDIKFTMAQLW
jgi:hypothetical protein